MFEKREQKVGEWVEREHGEGFAACKELIEYLAGMLEPWCGGPIEREHDGIMGALLARSIKTFAAIPHLVRNGYGEQAAMLGRSLFEDMVDAHWVSLHPELSVERYEQQITHNSMVLAERVAKHPNIYPDIELPIHDEDERKRLNAIFGRYGDRSWTGLSLHERTTAIESCWKDEEGRGHFLFIRDIAHRLNNQLLHAGAYSLNQTLRRQDGESLSYKLGPSNDHIDQVVFNVYWIFLQTASLMVEHFELDTLDALAEMSDRHRASFSRPTEDDLRGVGRNDPCPCGSGKKLKKCHGAPK
jgi:hypothetical protein